jgi:hypothetical protein
MDLHHGSEGVEGKGVLALFQVKATFVLERMLGDA